MKYAELEEFEKLADTDSEDRHWEALIALEPHLEDWCVEVDSIQFERGLPNRMTLFRAFGGELCYIVVNDLGGVILGRIEDRSGDSLRHHIQRQLGDFDPRSDEIRSLAVTDTHRFTGNTLDLWIMVQRRKRDDPDGTEFGLYHGIIAVGGLEPLNLRIPQDDYCQDQPASWLPETVSPQNRRIPRWLFYLNFSVDLCNAATVPKNLKLWLPSDRRAVLDAISFAGTWLAYTMGRELCFFDVRRGYSVRLAIPDRGYCLSLCPVRDGLLYGVVGCQDRSLNYFCVKPNESKLIQDKTWAPERDDESRPTHFHARILEKMDYPDHPTALGLVDNTPSSDASGYAVHDLLVLERAGRLAQYRFMDNHRIKHAWTQSVRRLGLTDPDGIVKPTWLDSRWQPSRGVALTYAALEACLNASAPGQAELEETRMRGLLRLLRRFHDRRDFPPRIWRRLVGRPQEAAGFDFQMVLLYRLYVEEFSAMDRRRVVVELAGEQWRGIKGNPWLECLQEEIKAGNWQAQPDRPLAGLGELLAQWSNDFYVEGVAPRLVLRRRLESGQVGLLEYGGGANASSPLLLAAVGGVLFAFDPVAGGRWQRISGFKADHKIDCLLALPPVLGGCVALVERTAEGCGILRLLRIARGDGGWRGEPFHCQELQVPGYSHLVCAAEAGDMVLLAVLVNRGRMADLRVFAIHKNAIQPWPTKTLPLPWVRTVDLAGDGRGGFRLIAATDQASAARLYRLESGDVRLERSFDLLKRGTSAVAFGVVQGMPRWLLVGGVDGGLWCADLGGGEAELRWTGRLSGPVTLLRALPDGKSFLAGTLDKNLYLLRVAEGQWERRIHLPGAVEAAVFGEQRLWVLVRGAGVYELGCPGNQEQEALLRRIEQTLGGLAAIPSSPWRIDAPAWAVYRAVKKDKESPVAILDDTHEREARAVLILYLLKTGQADRDIKLHWVKTARLNELYSLLNEPGEDAEEVLQAVKLRLRQEKADEPGACDAMLALLHHLAARPLTLEQLLEFVPATYIDRHPSVARETVRLLLKAGRLAAQEQGADVLPVILPSLFSLPSKALFELQSLVRPGSDEERQFEALAVLLDAAGRNRELETALRELEHRFAQLAEQDELNRLVAALLRFHRLCWVCQAEERPWSAWRIEALAALAGLIKAIHVPWVPEKVLKEALLRGLRACLANVLPPEDHEPREQGIAWAEAMRRYLDTAPPPARVGLEPDWPGVLEQLLRRTREVLQSLFRLEYEHQLALARPRLQALEILRLEDNRVRLRLRIEPEAGSRTLDGVSVVCKCYLQSGHSEETLHYLVYPPKVRSEELSFEGFLPASQTDLTVLVKLRAANGYRNETRWRFELPRARKEMDKKNWPPALERIFADFRARLFNCDSAMALVSIDQGMGYYTLLAEWEAQEGMRRINLDQRLGDIGPGRRYANRALDVEALLEPLQEEWEHHREVSKRASPVWVVAPLGETLERLFVAGAGETLKTWLLRLRQMAQTLAPGRLRLVVSTHHAARLRALGLDGFQEIALHRHVWWPSAQSGLRAALRDMVIEHNGVPARQAEAWLDKMGYDLRLISRWHKQGEGKGQEDFIAFLESEETQGLLHGELASLGILELSAAMAGAVSHSHVLLQQVLPGQYAARDYYSTVRHESNTPKLLQKAGSAFSAESLARLWADAAPPGHLFLEGFGAAVICESEQTALLPMLSLHRKELDTVFSRLEDLGIGRCLGGVFRTASPYRDYIAACYAQPHARTAPSRDAWVLSYLAGAERDPGELLRPADLIHAAKEDVAEMLPAANPRELEALRAIAQAWKADATLSQVTACSKLFPEAHWLQSPPRWIAALMGFKLTCLGIGKVALRKQDGRGVGWEPADYLFWLADAAGFDYDGFRKLAGDCLTMRPAQLVGQAYEADTHVPKILLTGPGVEALPPDPGRSLALWRFADYARSAWRGGMVEGLWARARAQLRLTAFSPYRTSGGLPPGSPLFVGRETELDFILHKLEVASILVVGCRRVGKTSLLNRVFHEIAGHPRLAPVYLDLQGISDRKSFLKSLLACRDDSNFANTLAKMDFSAESEPRSVLRNLGKSLRDHGKLAVFLLNEVDALAEHDKELMEIFRGLNDQGLARFLFVGYSVLRHLGEIDAPLFHFTDGLHFGGKAISLAELSPPAAERLLDQLAAPPLGLRWRNEEERKQAYADLLKRSYRIPWVLQRYGQLLVEHLERERREEIRLEDVSRLLHEQGQVVWQYINQIDYANLGYRGRKNAQKPGFLIILYALARKYYFQGGSKAAIRDPRLSQRRALDLGFRRSDVWEAVQDSIHALLRGDEQRIFLDWFGRLDLSQALKLLTLTLILEPDSIENERYGFLLHIFPMELYHLYRNTDPTLDDLIIRTTEDFLKTIKTGEGH